MMRVEKAECAAREMHAVQRYTTAGRRALRRGDPGERGTGPAGLTLSRHRVSAHGWPVGPARDATDAFSTNLKSYIAP